MNFTVDDKAKKKIEAWKKTLPESDPGVSGGRFTYSFTPTSIGTILMIIDSVTTARIDVTDYENW